MSAEHRDEWVSYCSHVLHTAAGDQSCECAPPLIEVVEENERLRAFAFGDAPEWEKANATLKHRVRELEAEVAELRGGARR
jgi:cell division protein FtsB